jgi:hypothetical protein
LLPILSSVPLAVAGERAFDHACMAVPPFR